MDSIQWREWSEEAFREAGEAGKPLLLAISAVWCHWCHVMDNETYTDPRIIELANEQFVALRADTDRRPDINARYNVGGWPSTVFLTPEADILTGATYLPAEQMLDLMKRVVDVYGSGREELLDRARELREQIASERSETSEGSAILTDGLAARVLRSIIESYDTRYGGFGMQQKFPHTDTLDFLINEYHRTADRDLLDIITNTLDAMDVGELHDTIGGGFFRYSTQSDWSVPHYEKMLEDNTALMEIYASAYKQTGKHKYLDVALDVSRYLIEWLYDVENGVFFGSQDADEEYYLLSAHERAARQAPRVDKTVFTNWNAQAVHSYLKLYQATLNQDFRDIALKTLHFLTNNVRATDGLYAHYYLDGKAMTFGLLTDQVPMLWALITAYESTGNPDYRAQAIELAGLIERYFQDSGSTLYDITEDRMQKEKLGFRERSLEDNALAARAFYRLSYITRDPSWKQDAEGILRAMALIYEDYGMMASPYALSVMEVLEEPVNVHIVGRQDAPETEHLIESAISAKEPAKIVQAYDPELAEAELEDMEMEPAREGKPTAYVCRGTTCQSATDDPEILTHTIAGVGGHPGDVETE